MSNEILKAVVLDTPIDRMIPKGKVKGRYNQDSTEITGNAVSGKVSFYGKPTFVGRRDIDWSGQHHHHQEWRAQLNRFFQLSHLARAYRNTGNEEYAVAARDYIADWIRANPTRGGWKLSPYDNTLNLSIRIGNRPGEGWLGSLPSFWNSPAFDEEFRVELLESAVCQVNFECDNIPPSGNWRIFAAECLLHASVRLPGLPDAERWRDTGVTALNDAFRRQVLADGAHIERTPSYHTGMTGTMSRLWELANAMPELGLAVSAESVARMWDYAAASCRPNGQTNALHDSLGRRTTAGDDELDVLRKRAAFRSKAGLPETDPEPRSFFPDAGQALLRSDWSPDATYVVYDATPWGGGHSHRGCNAVQLHAHGRTMLADPGLFSYEMSDPFAAYGKSTRAHSTCSLNGWTQPVADPERTAYYRGNGCDVVTSQWNAGYCSGTLLWSFTHHGTTLWASHKRTMVWLHHLGLVVLDSMTRQRNVPHDKETGADCPSFECNWQLCEESAVEVASDGRRAVASWRNCGLVMLFPLMPDGSSVSVHEGGKEPIRGWMSNGPDGYVPAPQVSVTLDPMLPETVHLCSVLVPFAGRQPEVSATCESDWRSGSLHVNHAGGADILHWSWDRTLMLGKRGGFETDASLLHLRKNQSGEVIASSAIDGTFLKIDGELKTM